MLTEEGEKRLRRAYVATVRNGEVMWLVEKFALLTGIRMCEQAFLRCALATPGPIANTHRPRSTWPGKQTLGGLIWACGAPWPWPHGTGGTGRSGPW